VKPAALILHGLLMGAALLASAPAAAQVDEAYKPTGRRTAVPVAKADPSLARRLLKGVAHCIQRRHPDMVTRFLATSDRLSPSLDALGGSDAALAGMEFSKCLSDTKAGYELNVEMRFNAPALRAALTEEAFLASNPRKFALPQGAAEGVADRFFVESARITQARALGAFADCVTFTATNEADALLRTAPGSVQETAGAQALAPAISACLPNGQSANLTANSIREIAADSLWERSRAAGGSAAGKVQ
jgi:hypothetical protein